MSFSAVSLSHLNTMGLSASANQLVQYPTSVLPDVGAQPIYILGGGSNTVFVEHFHGCVIHPISQDIRYSENQHGWFIEADAGVEWHQLVMQSLQKGIHGLENLALIPGCVGAAPVQNIGAYGVQFADVCDYVECVDLRNGETRRLTAAQCQFDYRYSIFKGELAQHWLVTRVGIRLTKQWQPQLSYRGLTDAFAEAEPSALAICEQVVNTRQAKLPDPAKLGNAGSFFKNPYVSEAQLNALLAEHPNLVHFREGTRWKVAAGWLIDQLGWKGKHYGGAAVHEQQALVLVNRDAATGKDIVGLAWNIQQQVQQVFDITLEPEACLVGQHGMMTLEQAYEITHL